MADDNVWIATRTFRDESGAEWTASVGIPRKGMMSRHVWVCPFRIVNGEGEATIDYAQGIDEMSALSNSFDALRVELGKADKKLSWFVTQDGQEKLAGQVPGDVGFCRSLPCEFGWDFYERMLELVDSEAEKLVADKKARYQSRLNRQGPQ